MRRIDPVDSLFFCLERRHQPMHVGGLLLFAPPADAPSDFVDNLVSGLRENTNPSPVFRHTARPGAHHRHADTLDMTYHVRHLRVPAPGRFDDLLALTGQLHATPLDRDKPLWTCHVIDGLADGGFALFYRIHHALADGIHAMQLCRNVLSTDPADTAPPAVWTAKTDNGQSGSDAWPQQLAAALPAAAREVINDWRNHSRGADTRLARCAPQTPFNQRIGRHRTLAATTLSLSRVRAVARWHDATVNDMVLACCAGALRRYLIDRQALPDSPLVAMMPMALQAERPHAHNQLTMACPRLATQLADPVARLRAIRDDVDYWKRRYAHMDKAEATAFAALSAAPAGINLLTGLAPSRQAFNVVISNVRGPEDTRYARGAPLQTLIPTSVVMDGLALNITVTSYGDQLTFGLVACADAVPDLDALAVGLTDAFAALARAG